MKDLYTALFLRRLTTSKRHFSTYWCSRAPNYLALGGGLSTDAKLAVFRRLMARHRWLLAAQVGWLVLFGDREA
ncbi:hypothetical protein ACN2C7_16695 [Caulobacter sp. ErkDOM-E]|uniref:hypothetical protein n=1 Tax=Caulobacter sp. ErkDOM-E TaxID=3402778 RepID=UPI003AF7815C